MAINTHKTEMVEALVRGLAVIESFDAAHSEMTLSEVAERTNLTPATARRILRTLDMLGYVGQTGKRFFLRPRILSLGSAFIQTARIDEALYPELRRIVDRFGDAASIGILNGNDVFYIAHLSEQRAMRPAAGLGVSYPAHATSLGKVLLAGLQPDMFENFLRSSPLTRMTDQTICDPDILRVHVSDARKAGFATSRDELAFGVTALAVPVVVPGKGVVAAVNSSGYSGRVSRETLIAERLEELQLTARRIADALVRYPQLAGALIGTVWSTPSNEHVE